MTADIFNQASENIRILIIVRIICLIVSHFSGHYLLRMQRGGREGGLT